MANAGGKKRAAPPFVPPDDRPSAFPFQPIHEQLESAIQRLSFGLARNAGRNAFQHLRRAWILHPVDSEMSLFRGITAEEEAATAVIHALRKRKYPNADQLNPRNHTHKASISPFIQAVSHAFAEKKMPTPSMRLNRKGVPRIDLLVDIGAHAGLDESHWIQPDEPFNFHMASDRTGPFQTHDFTEELSNLASGRGAQGIKEYIKKEANLRNKILYASQEGIPSVEFSDDALIERLSRVTAMLYLTIAILQSQVHQLFLVQSLNALLRALHDFDGEDVTFPSLNPMTERLELRQMPDGRMELYHVKPLRSLSFSFTISPDGGSALKIEAEDGH